MYTLLNFGSSAGKDIATQYLPKMPARDGLRWCYEGDCTHITLTDPTDNSLILSLEAVEKAGGSNPPLKLIDPVDDVAHALAAATLLGKHMPDKEARRHTLQAFTSILLRDNKSASRSDMGVTAKP